MEFYTWIRYRYGVLHGTHAGDVGLARDAGFINVNMIDFSRFLLVRKVLTF